MRRHHRSAGFGIHSPFAYAFVREVLCQRLPYYAYEDLHSLRRAVISAVSSRWPHPRIISLKNAKLLFRVANAFNPSHILQLGTCYGVSAASMMEVSSGSRMWLYEPRLARFDVVGRVLAPYLHRLECYDDLGVALADYDAALEGQAFVLVNDLDGADLDTLRSWLTQTIERGGVAVMRHLERNAALRSLWHDLRQAMPFGQTFTNGKTAVVVADRKLPRQDFEIWF